MTELLRERYSTYISTKLGALAYTINLNGKLNLLSLNVHSEDFFMHFLNLIFKWDLVNINQSKSNFDSIDLIDRKRKIIAQVTATHTRKKIESSLAGLVNYPGYTYKFIAITENASNLKGKVFQNPNQILFDSNSDIIDNLVIMKYINSLQAIDIEPIYQFVRNELGEEIQIHKIDTHLATLINILAKDNLSNYEKVVQKIPFNVDKKIEHNKLIGSKTTIEEYKIFYSRVDDLYAEFDKDGANRSRSVLGSIQGIYSKEVINESGDSLFTKVVSDVIERVESSINYVPIAFDELELCVRILVVNAFIKCKIFENPEGYLNVDS